MASYDKWTGVSMSPGVARIIRQSCESADLARGREGQTGELALHLAVNPPNGIVNDITVDHSITMREVIEELPDGTIRLIREIKHADLMHMRSDARRR